MVRRRFITKVEAAEILLEELDGGWLEVKKVSNGHGYVRRVFMENTKWYRGFCRAFRRVRRGRFRTFIKRCHTREALLRISRGEKVGVYKERLEPFLLKIMAKGIEVAEREVGELLEF